MNHESLTLRTRPEAKTPEPPNPLIKEGYERFDRDAFDAFLTGPKIDVTRPDLLEEFTRSYMQSFDSMSAACQAQAESLGWSDLLEAFRLRHRIPEELLIWNEDLLSEQISMAFRVVHHGGRVHLFFQ